MKYSIGEIVRIKATGEKVKILGIDCGVYCVKGIDWKYKNYSTESELKSYRPSRTGKFRNAKGQFISALDKAAQEQREHFSYEEPDSKQTNYQKILTKLDELEKKIDELGRKV